MAIISNFEYRDTKYDYVTFKIVRVFGSKREGWNAVFAFVPDELDFVEDNFRGLITIGTEWVDGNPYPVLYKKMEEILVNGGFELLDKIKTATEWINSPEVSELVLDEIKKEVEKEAKPKRTRKTKVKKDGESSSDN